MRERDRHAADLPHPIPNALVELVADRLAVLGQPMRIRVVDHLAHRGETSVQALADALDAGQPNVSKHLGVLFRAGVISRRRHGRTTSYSIVDDRAYPLLSHAADDVLGQLEQLRRDT